MIPFEEQYDRWIAALCIWREARDEGVPGMKRIAHVLVNRLRDEDRWPNNLRDLVLQPCEFDVISSWADKAVVKFPTYDEMRSALDAVEWALNSGADDPVKGANYFLRIDGATTGSFDERYVVARYKSHVYFKL